MRTEQINYLAQIAESGSLHKAAENLHISVQALAMSLSSLEHELGLNLTVRQKNGTTMTTDGEKVLQAGKHFFAERAQIKRESLSFSYLSTDQYFDLALTDGVLETDWPMIASNIYRDFPKLKIVTHPIQADLIPRVPAFLTLFYQITLNGHDMLQLDHLASQFHPLRKQKYRCLISEKSSLCTKSSVSLKDILSSQILIYTPTKALFDLLLQSTGSRHHVLYIDNFAVYKQMLIDGHGAGFFAESDRKIYHPALRALPFKENICSTFGYTCPENPANAQATAEFCRYLNTLYSI